MRGLIVVFRAALVFSVLAPLARADTCFMDGSSVPGELGIEICSQTPTGPDQFTLPRFDPSLGTLTDYEPGTPAVDLYFSGTLFGSVDFNYEGTQCIGMPIHCLDFGAEVTASAEANSSVGSFPFAATPPSQPIPVGLVAGCYCNYSSSFSWMYSAAPPPPSYGVFEFSAANSAPFVGTTPILFDIVSTASYYSAGPGVITGSSVDASAQAMVAYSFIVATVPEPSLMLITAVLFGLVVISAAVPALTHPSQSEGRNQKLKGIGDREPPALAMTA